MKNNRIRHNRFRKFLKSRDLRKCGLILLGIFFLSTSVWAQTAIVSLSFKDTTVAAVLNEIRNQTDISFIYNHEEIEKCPKVTVNVVDATVEEVLNLSLKNSGMTYKKVNNNIVITPLPPEVDFSFVIRDTICL